MLNPNPRTRLATTSFVDEAIQSGFWADNPLTSLITGLDGFELLSEGDKLSLLRTIKDAASTGAIPSPFLLYRVLPSLLHSLSLPSAPSGAMLPLVLELGKLVPPGDYGKLVLDPVVRLYASPDRGTRMALLDGLGEYAEKMDARIVQERVWPHLVRAALMQDELSYNVQITGFADTVPVIREATVKAVYPLASKVSPRPRIIAHIVVVGSHSQQRPPPTLGQNADRHRAFNPHKHLHLDRSLGAFAGPEHQEKGPRPSVCEKLERSIRSRQSCWVDGAHGDRRVVRSR